jgi:hypothetical protein
MKNKNSYILFIIVLFVCLVTSGVVAFYSTSVNVEKKINMGLVDVQLKTFVDVDGVNVEYTSNDLEITNEQFSYIPVVYNKNNSGDCFVRVKTYINTSNTSKVVTTNDVYNLNNTVMYGDDGYFYYKSILSPSDNVKIYDGLILDNLNNYKNETLRVVTVVEAIQAKNFAVDFTTNTPWGDLSNIEIKALQVSNNVSGG